METKIWCKRQLSKNLIFSNEYNNCRLPVKSPSGSNTRLSLLQSIILRLLLKYRRFYDVFHLIIYNLVNFNCFRFWVKLYVKVIHIIYKIVHLIIRKLRVQIEQHIWFFWLKNVVFHSRRKLERNFEKKPTEN